MVAPSHLMLVRSSALGSLAVARAAREDFDEVILYASQVCSSVRS